jgi:hypothetical protein
LPHLPGEDDEKKVESDSESEGQEAMDSEVQDELEKASSYVTRLSNESGDEAADAAERSPRYSSVWHSPRAYTIDSNDTNRIINGAIFRPSRPWKCPVLSCQYHDYGLSTEEERDHHYSDKHSETPVENTSESFNPAHFDILHLHHKKSIYTFEFPLHDIRDGRLQVSEIRAQAARLTFVPESFRHLVELSCKDTKLLIDATPIRNYGISSGDSIKVKSPQFRKSDQFGDSPSKDPVLDNGHGTEGNRELEGKVERDNRRAEFSRELRQRAVIDSSSDQVPVPKTASDLELRGTFQASAPNQPPGEADSKVAIAPRPGVGCPTCALGGKEIWVIPGRCCGYCGTPCVDEDTLDVHDPFRATNINDNEERLPLFTATGVNDNNEERLRSTPEGPQKKEVSCPSFLVYGYCMDGAECPFIHDPAMISTSDPSSKQTNIVEPLPDPELTMNRKELEVWKALCALEDDLELGWLPICRETINSDEVSSKKREQRLRLINGIDSNIIRQLRRIEELSEPDIKAKRRHIEEKVDKLLARLGVESMTVTDSYSIK